MNQTSEYPRISVVVNNYNYARFLREALDSTLAQLHDIDELIVVDDGSTDASLAILEAYRGHRSVTVIEQKNQGQLKAVRTGIEAASGDIVALLDSDDFFLEGYLDRLREIFRDHPQVSFTFTLPEVSGEDIAKVRDTRNILHHMAFLPGEVGSSRWAALLFQEYIGVPTSGLALQRSLAEKIMSLPEDADETIRLNAITRMAWGISIQEANQHGFSADGIIVRSASVLGAVKYYNDQPGFMYRIHGGNKYASVPRRGRWFMRTHRKKQMSDLFCRHFAINQYPTCDELCEEIRSRSWALYWRRRMRIRLEYCLAALHSHGTLRQKLLVIKTAAWDTA
jgi:glycosyltransferase involved in cell wall biosynthesis